MLLGTTNNCNSLIIVVLLDDLQKAKADMINTI